ncbi:hypothetical protein CEXT_618601 [Caerostris extrusa]|uniref:Uncharacterized protein n=1 Tax=Caerostris extrusa TaxID=172846 RepID=A0AAV4PZS1_CAEEX|nr:hypothetical protein CEXT_618601 [Caerostris extrusa]
MSFTLKNNRKSVKKLKPSKETHFRVSPSMEMPIKSEAGAHKKFEKPSGNPKQGSCCVWKTQYLGMESPKSVDDETFSTSNPDGVSKLLISNYSHDDTITQIVSPIHTLRRPYNILLCYSNSR